MSDSVRYVLGEERIPKAWYNQAYSDYFAGTLVDQAYDERELAMALAGLPAVAAG